MTTEHTHSVEKSTVEYTTTEMSAIEMSTPETSTVEISTLETTTVKMSTLETFSLKMGKNSCCMVICDGNSSLTSEEIEEKIEELIEILTVPKKNISALHRRKICAEDKRQSAKVMGACGSIVLTLIGAVFVLMDVQYIVAGYQYMRMLFNKKYEK